MIGSLGENLIFLISQPHAGSTLLQRILACHAEIQTLSEPWLMLHPLYALRTSGHSADYHANTAQAALTRFLQSLPLGEEEYFLGLRRMYVYLYNRALEGSGKTCFLDKTPRYYAIIPELLRTFPQARFIILLRNPLAVLQSLKGSKNITLLTQCRYDLIEAPGCLLRGIETLGEHAALLRFENLLTDPESELQRLCADLGLVYQSGMIDYGTQDLPHWDLGNQETVYANSSPNPELVDIWQKQLDDPLSWRLLRNYLEYLGRDTLSEMGYSYDEMRAILRSRQPGFLQRGLTYPAGKIYWLMEWLTRWDRLATSEGPRAALGSIFTHGH